MMALKMGASWRSSFAVIACVICLWSTLPVVWTVTTSNSSYNSIGVNYGQLSSSLPSPLKVVQIIVQSTSIRKLKLYDANPSIIEGFSNTGIELIVGITNNQIAGMVDPNVAMVWVSQNVGAYLPATKITTICVGNEVLTSGDWQLISHLVPVMENLHIALVDLKLDDQVKVSTPHSCSVLSVSFPPSAGTFRPELSQYFIKPLLSFLSRTNSPFMVNVYPYFAYRNNYSDISLAYALFLPNSGVTDPSTGMIYSNLFGAQLDAFYSAMEKLNCTDVLVGVSETGWPSQGDPNEPGVSIQNAMTYNKNLIYYIATNPGTPLRPRRPINTFIFSLFNENLKLGPTSERNFGLFNTDGTEVYDLGLTTPSSSPSTTNSNTSVQGSKNGSNSGIHGGSSQVWCIAKPGMTASVLGAAISYACGEGGANCSAIQPSGSCFYPNDVASHASFAFNAYYQMHGRNTWNCNFDNSAMISTSDPSYGDCKFPYYS
ncbi:hypothetical protein O6H91_04G016300 [Diphasiastrum complanatum]|uniref:Uncharacterized protein n=3 Tax=Diphasiastrum complanatum TaxID=34168 RepID=A0ACC2DUK5_DIPCM|nr:hypothetical protein O6H91_04G016300 [Diphasiastrum complanatum]KAJ7557929.1 hypothetical protein O6H91_04G016300 [Diphasiastrum complanatum]KAJ7557930.1 hypothetical protein O6H91_04G016300 [Diphasiastrum complanatum]